MEALPLPQTKRSSPGVPISAWTSPKRLHFLNSLQNWLAKSAQTRRRSRLGRPEKGCTSSTPCKAALPNQPRPGVDLGLDVPKKAALPQLPAKLACQISPDQASISAGRPEKGCTSSTPCKAALPNQPRPGVDLGLDVPKKAALPQLPAKLACQISPDQASISAWTSRKRLHFLNSLQGCLAKSAQTRRRSRLGRPQKGCTSSTPCKTGLPNQPRPGVDLGLDVPKKAALPQLPARLPCQISPDQASISAWTSPKRLHFLNSLQNWLAKSAQTRRRSRLGRPEKGCTSSTPCKAALPNQPRPGVDLGLDVPKKAALPQLPAKLACQISPDQASISAWTSRKRLHFLNSLQGCLAKSAQTRRRSRLGRPQKGCTSSTPCKTGLPNQPRPGVDLGLDVPKKAALPQLPARLPCQISPDQASISAWTSPKRLHFLNSLQNWLAKSAQTRRRSRLGRPEKGCTSSTPCKAALPNQPRPGVDLGLDVPKKAALPQLPAKLACQISPDQASISAWTSRKRLHFLNSLQGCLAKSAQTRRRSRLGRPEKGCTSSTPCKTGLPNQPRPGVDLGLDVPKKAALPQLPARLPCQISPDQASISAWTSPKRLHFLNSLQNWLAKSAQTRRRSRLGRPEKGCTSSTPCKTGLPNQDQASISAWTSRKRLHFLNSLQGCLAKSAQTRRRSRLGRPQKGCTSSTPCKAALPNQPRPGVDLGLDVPKKAALPQLPAKLACQISPDQASISAWTCQISPDQASISAWMSPKRLHFLNSLQNWLAKSAQTRRRSRLGRPEKGCTSSTPCKTGFSPDQASISAWTSPKRLHFLNSFKAALPNQPRPGVDLGLDIPKKAALPQLPAKLACQISPDQASISAWTSRKRLHFLNSCKTGLPNQPRPGVDLGLDVPKKAALPQLPAKLACQISPDQASISAWTSPKRLHFLNSLQNWLAKSAQTRRRSRLGRPQKGCTSSTPCKTGLQNQPRPGVDLGLSRKRLHFCLASAQTRRRSRLGRPQKGCTSLTPSRSRRSRLGRP